MRPILALAALAALSACTPAEVCRIDATRDLSALDRQIRETEEGISKGYRLVQINTPPHGTFFGCLGETSPLCFDDDWSPTYRHERLNIPAERAKLASLRTQRAAAEERARRDLAACPQE